MICCKNIMDVALLYIQIKSVLIYRKIFYLVIFFLILLNYNFNPIFNFFFLFRIGIM